MSVSRDLAVTGSKLRSQALETTGRPLSRQAGRELDRTVAEGIVENTREQVRAALTNTALQNVGALSALEQHLIEVAPLGANRYQHIVDAYAIGAAQTIARW